MQDRWVEGGRAEEAGDLSDGGGVEGGRVGSEGGCWRGVARVWGVSCGLGGIGGGRGDGGEPFASENVPEAGHDGGDAGGLSDRSGAGGINDAGHVMAVTRIHVVTSSPKFSQHFIRLDSIPEFTNSIITFPRKLFVQV